MKDGLVAVLSSFTLSSALSVASKLKSLSNLAAIDPSIAATASASGVAADPPDLDFNARTERFTQDKLPVQRATQTGGKQVQAWFTDDDRHAHQKITIG